MEFVASIPSQLRQTPTELIIKSIYGDFGFAADAQFRQEVIEAIVAVAKILPNDIVSCLRAADEITRNDTERLILLQATLRALSSDTMWVHYNLAVLLNRLSHTGVLIAQGPCILHTATVIASAGAQDTAQLFATEILGVSLIDLASRDAVRMLLNSIRLGNNGALQALIKNAARLGVKNTQLIDVGPYGLEHIATEVGLSQIFEHSIVRFPSDIHDVVTVSAIMPAASTLIPPLGDIEHFIFRECPSSTTVPGIDVYMIPEGTVSYDFTKAGTGQFYIFSKEGYCISELSYGVTPFIAPEQHELSGTVGLISDRFSGPLNICHLILDQLTRAAIFEMAGCCCDRLLAFDQHAYSRSLGVLAGIQAQLCFAPNKCGSIKADVLLVPSNLNRDFRHPAHRGSKWALSWLTDRLVDPRSPTASKRLFIDRIGRRGINNRPEIVSMLETRGFELVKPEDLSVKDQIELFSAAEAVVGVHGAGLTNILFAKPGCAVVEILPSLQATDAYWCLASQLGHRYGAVIGDDPSVPRPDYANWRSLPAVSDRGLDVSVSRLQAILAQLEIEAA